MPRIIYGLVDPRDQKEFYVGRTEDLYRRFYQHLKRLINWIVQRRSACEKREPYTRDLWYHLEYAQSVNWQEEIEAAMDQYKAFCSACHISR